VEASGVGGAFFTSSNEEEGSKLIVSNGNFTHFSQNSIDYASSFIMANKYIEITINE